MTQSVSATGVILLGWRGNLLPLGGGASHEPQRVLEVGDGVFSNLPPSASPLQRWAISLSLFPFLDIRLVLVSVIKTDATIVIIS